MNLKSWFLGLGLMAALYTNAYAADIFNGCRGPTDYQIDQRIICSKNDRQKSTTNSMFLKYWDGDEHGKWFMLQMPYKSVNAKNGSLNGLGDISLLAGPRGRTGDFNYLLYGGLTLPTGKELGNQRTDIKLGGMFTQILNNGKNEIDGSLEYAFTGINKKGINSPDELSAGLLFGGEAFKNTRFVIGPEYSGRMNGDYSLNLRSVLRYTPPNQNTIHFEALYDTPLSSQNIPKTTNFGIFMRYNF